MVDTNLHRQQLGVLALALDRQAADKLAAGKPAAGTLAVGTLAADKLAADKRALGYKLGLGRSEERRVGKEC